MWFRPAFAQHNSRKKGSPPDNLSLVVCCAVLRCVVDLQLHFQHNQQWQWQWQWQRERQRQLAVERPVDCAEFGFLTRLNLLTNCLLPQFGSFLLKAPHKTHYNKPAIALFPSFQLCILNFKF